MKNNIASLTTALLILAASAALPAYAQVGVGVSVSSSAGVNGGGVRLNANADANLTTRLVNMTSRANQEIKRRTDALNTMSIRINAMVKLSSDEKTSLSSMIQAQIDALGALDAKVGTDSSDLTNLKTDVQSITKAYRIFVLVIPQGAIEAASDRVMTMVGSASTLSAKLQTRITDAQSTGNNMDASVTALADFNTKVADANIQAQAAVAEVVNLTPDNGDQAQMQSNTAALQDARAKIKAAEQDLIAARKDAGIIVKALIALNASAQASETVSGSGQY